MFGLGTQEILLLLILAGGVVGIVLLVLFLSRRGGDGRVAELEAENRRLRDELDRHRGGG